MGLSISHCKDVDAALPSGQSQAYQEDSGDAVPVKAAKQVEKVEDEEEASKDNSEEEGDEGEEEEEDAQPVIKVKSIPYDARFPTTNQARNCYTRYNEFYRCVGQKSEEDDECKFYQRAYRSICPGEWVDKWNEQREAGTWPGKY